ncbi:cytochrome P450 [Sphaerimonospora sp. CA-214678]|uniref:cytochrome P450 n=1 Tax=Sphaerimonospora sp. CA-214678 TaxID=3240029 RepID=UPI003D9424F8
MTPNHARPAQAPTAPPGCPAPTGVPLYGPDFAADPGRVYEHLRQYGAAAPVQLAPGIHATLVTSYHLALDVLRNPELFSKDARRWKALAAGEVPADHPLLPMMAYRPNALFSDGYAHARLRQAITDSLARLNPHELRGDIQRHAHRLIDRFAPTGEADLIAQYAQGLPILVFSQMFGLADDAGDTLIHALAALFEGGDGAAEGYATYSRYLQDLVTLKRRQPGADVTSWLMAHPARLDDAEVLNQCVLLIGAGTEPVQNLIGNALRLLLSDERFGGGLSDGSTPIDDALEEVLWKDPPMANYAVHYPLYDVDLAGVRLPAGEPVVISLAAANTDPHGDPSLHRSGNRAHLAFSAGPHACPARDPARLIAAVAIERLLDRLSDLELAVPADRLNWRPGPFQRALTALPVRFTPTRVDSPSGGNAWTAPAPSTVWTSPAATSTPKPPSFAPPVQRPWWSSLTAWLRGR